MGAFGISRDGRQDALFAAVRSGERAHFRGQGLGARQRRRLAVDHEAGFRNGQLKCAQLIQLRIRRVGNGLVRLQVRVAVGADDFGQQGRRFPVELREGTWVRGVQQGLEHIEIDVQFGAALLQQGRGRSQTRQQLGCQAHRVFEQPGELTAGVQEVGGEHPVQVAVAGVQGLVVHIGEGHATHATEGVVHEVDPVGVDAHSGAKVGKCLVNGRQRCVQIEQVQGALAHVVPGIGVVGEVQEQAAGLGHLQHLGRLCQQVLIGGKAEVALGGVRRGGARIITGLDLFQTDRAGAENTMQGLIDGDGDVTVEVVVRVDTGQGGARGEGQGA